MTKKLLEEATVKRLQEMAGINEGYGYYGYGRNNPRYGRNVRVNTGSSNLGAWTDEHKEQIRNLEKGMYEALKPLMQEIVNKHSSTYRNFEFPTEAPRIPERLHSSVFEMEEVSRTENKVIKKVVLRKPEPGILPAQYVFLKLFMDTISQAFGRFDQVVGSLSEEERQKIKDVAKAVDVPT
jgi:hypothetical protein